MKYTTIILSKQDISSKETSVNILPKVFNIVDKKFGWQPNTINLDIGGGRYDKATNYLKDKKVTNLVYDKYWTSHNKETFVKLKESKADTCTIANVLNVIQDKDIRIRLIKMAKRYLKDNGTLYIGIYEGDKSGIGKETSKGFQMNKPTKDYLDDVKQVFPNANIKYNLIIAEK